ncbi:Uncharacterised protein [Mycobacterium tuberculosis]|uniref:Uncharacterized protein n=1 Tax=Mycobacterium tuberculosis TaxID=1773 RepID=A0A916LGM3_MYCTX|nr:Uncharacterised protein [Mycobacterium tuberculosis]
MRFSLRARSFTASNTSSSMDNVVRMHQMLSHQSGRNASTGWPALAALRISFVGALPREVGADDHHLCPWQR